MLRKQERALHPAVARPAVGYRGDEAEPVLSESGNPEFGDATVALEMGNDLYIGTFRSDRIAYTPIKE
jgi:hypothetical protein